jgi:hypothetical protein
MDRRQFGFFVGGTVQLSIGQVSGFNPIKQKRVLIMVAYEFYRRDEKGKDHFIWILPERRRNPERITQESIINWGRKAVVDHSEVKGIFFIQVELDEEQIESRGLIPLSELRKKFKK